ncbi:MAG: FeoA family protein [Verrucomicrobia bacterium]|nr:FeoA family protein [Verrucomicrobiota bacterium]
MTLPTTKLVELEPHKWGEIVDIDVPEEEKRRMMSMGICPGRTVELVLRGDPLIVRVFGTRIGLSARLADRITVVPCVDDCDEDAEDAEVEFNIDALPPDLH